MTALRSHEFDSATEAVLSAACAEHEVHLVIGQNADGEVAGTIWGNILGVPRRVNAHHKDRSVVAANLSWTLRRWFPSACEPCIGSGTCESDDWERDGVATCGCRA